MVVGTRASSANNSNPCSVCPHSGPGDQHDLFEGNAHGRKLPNELWRAFHHNRPSDSEDPPDGWNDSVGFSEWFWFWRDKFLLTIKIRLPITQTLTEVSGAAMAYFGHDLLWPRPALAANHSPSRAVLADVAVSSTPMAIIAQHGPVPARPQRGFRWKVQLPESAVHTNYFSVGHGPPTTLEDAHRLEVVVDGLPLSLHGGARLAVDTTLVSALHGDRRPRRGASERDGVALLAARKHGTSCLELLRRARLVVLAVEVGGRFSPSGFLKK